jgi:hypothetical protein
MTYIIGRWRMTAILVSLLLLAELACVGTLRAQLKEALLNPSGPLTGVCLWAPGFRGNIT